MMEEMIKINGYPTIDEIRKNNGWPSDERFAKGPVAICECVQEIPCNPCEAACPRHAIAVGEPITNTPRVDNDSCTGCGMCIACCPGLAIFVIDKTYSETMATVSFPFEYLPLPEKGDKVKAVARDGSAVCEGEIVKILDPKRNDHTPVVTVAVPKAFADDVRSIMRPGVSGDEAGFEPFVPEGYIDDDVIVCRCEEVTAGEIRKAVREYEGDSLTGIKRRVRAGMGLCQGRTCGKLVTRIIQEELGKRADEVAQGTRRPPVRPVTFGELAGKDGGEDDGE